MSVIGTIGANGVCTANVSFIKPTATDNCTTSVGLSNNAPTVFPSGTTTVTWTVTDDCGNKSTCSTVIEVNCLPQSDFPGFKCGQAVVSCFSGFSPPNSGIFDPNGPVIATVDVRQHATAPLGVNWASASANNIYHKSDWTAANMGQVFGVTIDAQNNVYAASTTMYGNYSPLNNAAYGNIYKIDALTGNVSIFGTLPQGTKPAGLGDVWYDAPNNRLLVSNFYDGIIYTSNPLTGASTGTFTPFYDFPGTPIIGPPLAPGFVFLGERVWAIATNGNKMYFSVWSEDRFRPNLKGKNQIWSVALVGGVPTTFTTTATLEHDMSDLITLTPQTYSSPVSDIQFSQSGKMLVAERAMDYDFGNAAVCPKCQAHEARVIEITAPYNSLANEKIFYVGNPYDDTGSKTIYHANSSGGISYGYESFNPKITPLPLQCDSMVWSTGDALRYPGFNFIKDPSTVLCGGGFGDFVYGLAGMRSSGNSNIPGNSNYVNTSSIYIDVDNNICDFKKSEIGDIDIFKCLYCDSCLCGAFTGMTFRPTQGGQTSLVRCGDTLGIGCNPTFNPIVAGTFQCSGNNCTNTPITWELRKPVGGPVIASGSGNYPNFSTPLLASYFTTNGLYELIFRGQCGKQRCDSCRFIIKATGCPCKCDIFDKIKIINKKTGFSQNLTCNNEPPNNELPIALPCPPVGKPYIITGKLVCNPLTCKAHTLTWVIKQGSKPAGGGTQIGPWFSIPLLNSTFASGNGLYTVMLTGICGTDTCKCNFNFNVSGCPAPCPCDDTFGTQVAAGFNYTYDFSSGTCKWLFTPNKLNECYKVDWTVQGLNINYNATAATAGNQPLVLTFPNGSLGNYKIWMKVTIPGTKCVLTFCQIVSINCIITGGGLCVANELDNAGFSNNTTIGVLGQGGKSDGWVRRLGNPEIIGNTGATDSFALKIVGQCTPNWGDILDHPITVLPKKGFKISAYYKSSEDDLRPGTTLVVRLSDAPQSTTVCTTGCTEIVRIPISVATSENWSRISTTFLLDSLRGGSKYLTLHLENDLAYEDADANSTILLDNICFTQNDSTLVVDTKELGGMQERVHIFPNPNLGIFTVELPTPATSNMSFRVTDLTGKLMLEKQTKIGTQIQTVEAANLPDGFYFLQVVSEGKIIAVEKFVKQ